MRIYCPFVGCVGFGNGNEVPQVFNSRPLAGYEHLSLLQYLYHVYRKKMGLNEYVLLLSRC